MRKRQTLLRELNGHRWSSNHKNEANATRIGKKKRTKLCNLWPFKSFPSLSACLRSTETKNEADRNSLDAPTEKLSLMNRRQEDPGWVFTCKYTRTTTRRTGISSVGVCVCANFHQGGDGRQSFKLFFPFSISLRHSLVKIKGIEIKKKESQQPCLCEAVCCFKATKSFSLFS